MPNVNVLTSYAFIVVALGTSLLAAAAGAVGCINVLRGESLIGDAIGHATFPGVVFAFMLALQRNPAVLLLGALFTGAVAYLLIQLLNTHSKLDLDAILAVVLSAFFGMGMVLKSYIQGNPRYGRASQAGLQNYIFGQAAFIMRGDIKVIFAVAVGILLLLLLFYKEIKVSIFDCEYAAVIGLPSGIISGITVLMTLSVIATGLKLIGAILIASLLVIPAIIALQWSSRFDRVMIIAALSGGTSSLIGTYISTICNGMSTGPVIIVVMSLMALISLVFGPRGGLARFRIRRRYR